MVAVSSFVGLLAQLFAETMMKQAGYVGLHQQRLSECAVLSYQQQDHRGDGYCSSPACPESWQQPGYPEESVATVKTAPVTAVLSPKVAIEIDAIPNH